MITGKYEYMRGSLEYLFYGTYVVPEVLILLISFVLDLVSSIQQMSFFLITACLLNSKYK